MENVTLNPKEQARLQVLNSLLAEHMTLDQAATLMGVSPRHTRRILATYREKGAAAVAHGHRGRNPPNATPEPVATAVVHLARTRYAGTNHTHLSELLSDRDGIDIGRTTLRRILVNAGLSSPRRRRQPKHRVRRQRMPRQGMLIQMGGSHHPWLGDRIPPFTLLIAVDDATGTVVDALFCEKEDAHSYFLLIQRLLQRRGIPPRPVHRPARGLQAHARLRPPRDANPVQPGHGRTGDPDDIRPLSPGQGKSGADGGNFPGPPRKPNCGWQGRAASGKPTACWSSSCRDSTGVSVSHRNTLSLHSGPWTRSCAWNRSCASSTAEKWPGTTR